MWRMQRVYHEREQRDMDDPLVVRGLLQWLCFVTFFLARYVLDVLLTPDVVDDTVRSAWRGGRTALVKAWPLLRTCYAPLAPVLLMQVWKLATLDMLQWACGYACSFRLVMRSRSWRTIGRSPGKCLSASERSPLPMSSVWRPCKPGSSCAA